MKPKKKRRRRASSLVECPFCGEAEELHVDEGGGARQTYTEDCAVCCRPRVVHVEPGDEAGEIRIWLERGE
jgi:Cysteine-rich CPXCG